MNAKKHLSAILSVFLLLSCLVGCTSQKPEQGNIAPDIPVGKEVSLGRIESGTYTNTYTGYGCDLDSNWVFYSAEELQVFPENIQDILADSELGEVMEGYTQIFDMKAENANDLVSINVNYTQIPFQERLYYATKSQEEEIDSLLAQKDILTEGYAQAGISVNSMEKVFVTFLGEERVALKTDATIDGVGYYILQIQDYDLGAYGVSLTLSSFVEDKTEDLLALFFPVD